jgi:glycosyltransferase involved in cell wall biosynthesis
LEALQARVARAGAEDVFNFDLEFLSDAKLAEYLAAAGIVVFPYREIDGSGALSHAIRFEKPIVASRVGGFAEAPFRDYIELVPPEDASALAATLTGLLDAPSRLQYLEQQTRILQSKLPSWVDYALACRNAYREVMPKRKS